MNLRNADFLQVNFPSVIDWNFMLRMGNDWYDRIVEACRNQLLPNV